MFIIHPSEHVYLRLAHGTFTVFGYCKALEHFSGFFMRQRQFGGNVNFRGRFCSQVCLEFESQERGLNTKHF